jgi:hypothetical protein
VVVALDRCEVTLTLRVDHDALEDLPALWSRLAAPLSRAGTGELAVIGYTGADREPDVLAFAGSSPWPVLDVLRVQDGRWWSLTCPNGPTCCPPGEPYQPDPAVTAPLALATGSPAASREDLAACLLPGPPVLVEGVAALLPLDPVPADEALLHAVHAAHTERADGPIPLGPAQAALLLHAVSTTRVRDTSCAWHDDAAWWLWTDLIHATPPGWLAPPATLLAVTALQQGNTPVARLAAERALHADPGYRLARLVVGLIEAAVHPSAIRDAMAHAVQEAMNAHHRRNNDTDNDTKEITMTDHGSHATIHPGGYVTLDVRAWLDQRTGGPIDELTADLHQWASPTTEAPTTEAPTTEAPSDWLETAQTWVTDRGFEPASPEQAVTDVIAHVETRLDAEVWILRGTAPGWGPVAVVGINHEPPVVYADACTDSWDWFDADSVDITCPDGHGWTWRTGRELVTADGSFTTLSVVFGPDLDAPFTPCPHWRAYQAGQRPKPCGCGGAPWIICPVCGRRCDVHLPTR